MSHECRCHPTTELQSLATGAMAEQTVAELSKRPGALEVFEQFGINHCCGAHLSLREAAAAAGVSLPTLLCALSQPASTAA